MTHQLETRPGVAAIVRNDAGAILLHLRRVGGGWAPPSGHLEAGETIKDAVHREVREETGLTIQIERLIGVYSDPNFQIVTYPDGRRVHFVTCLLACRMVDGLLSGSEEGDRWAWFDAGALPQDLLPYARVWLADARDQQQHRPPIR